MDIGEELLEAILGCGSQDIESLFEKIVLAEQIGIQLEIDEIVEETRNRFTEINFNNLMYTTLYLFTEKYIETHLADDSHYENIISAFREKFSPYLNYLDSWYNNPLDDLNISPEDSKEEIMRKLQEVNKELIEWALE